MSIDSVFTPGLVAAQQPQWPDKSELDNAVSTLKKLPPLVFAGECDDIFQAFQ